MTSLSLASILAEPAWRRPDHIALIEGDHRLTFAELWQQVLRQAGALAGQGKDAAQGTGTGPETGVKPGDKVALMCPNTIEFPRAYYAILAAGGVVVPVHLLLTADEAETVLRDSGATLLIAHAMCAETAAKAAERAGVRLLTAGPDGRLEELTEQATPLPTFVTRQPEDPAVIFYTSGTTGTPKGAVLSHLNLVMNATTDAYDARDEVRRDDIVLASLPLFHTFGQTVSMNATWRLGATVVLLPRFDPDAAIALMAKERVTTFHGVPTMYVTLVEAAARAGTMPQLRRCVSGGASLPVPVLERFEAAFGAKVLEGYGLSETSPVASVNQLSIGTRAGTVGHPLWGVDVEVADPDVLDAIRLLPRGELGEIVIRGHNVFTGYLGRPEATAAAVVDGWFRTGDLGRRDADGFISIVDRTKDLIIRGGFNVYPREVEDTLLRMPGLTEVAVIGVPDDVHGEEIVAVVVAGAGVPSAEEILAYGDEHLGRHKYPRRVEFVDALPLGPSHKVLKRELRDRFSKPAD
ncbi:long-chain-fatty-acid--CoA ligase [Catenulispora pinisilvae]|uniref:long-chain-fatty-acid--CoA ligase n=1 Tax=Catenulispora pinisilvae TaxID=2705253 RepID=UPI00189198A6|nr:long-chain fatty acid--CoA ligase [Catenulispora pinisilvae]